MNNPSDVRSSEPVVGVEHHDQNAHPRIAQFREAFASSEFHLLEPVHPQVNYSFEAMPADPYTLELRADKWWVGENGRVENSTLTLNTYDLEQDEVQRETAREEALMEREDLLRIYAAQGLEAAMQKAEDIAINNDHLDEDRDDPRLFSEGPADRFLTQQEQALAVGDLLVEPPIDLEDMAPASVWQAGGDHEMWELDV